MARAWRAGKSSLSKSKYTDRSWLSFVENGGWLKTETLIQGCGLPGVPKGLLAGLAFTGSDQAHEGRLVNALAIRGDEGRGTLR